jgi:hypothetical protein
LKNLIEPQRLAELKSKPASYETVEAFLASEPKLAAGYVCKVVGIAPSNFYAWRRRSEKASAKSELKLQQPPSAVVPTSGSKRNYSAADKVALLRDYVACSDSNRGEFLRTYGLYASDIDRWREVTDRAAIEALSVRKQGRKATTPDQLKIAELERELHGQEKVISKLSAIVVIQKKVSTILGIPELT